jgi:hypothetical protein
MQGGCAMQILPRAKVSRGEPAGASSERGSPRKLLQMSLITRLKTQMTRIITHHAHSLVVGSSKSGVAKKTGQPRHS